MLVSGGAAGVAGVDLATPGPYQSVIARMNAIMDEMEEILARQ